MRRWFNKMVRRSRPELDRGPVIIEFSTDARFIEINFEPRELRPYVLRAST